MTDVLVVVEVELVVVEVELVAKPEKRQEVRNEEKKQIIIIHIVFVVVDVMVDVVMVVLDMVMLVTVVVVDVFGLTKIPTRSEARAMAIRRATNREIKMHGKEGGHRENFLPI